MIRIFRIFITGDHLSNTVGSLLTSNTINSSSLYLSSCQFAIPESDGQWKLLVRFGVVCYKRIILDTYSFVLLFLCLFQSNADNVITWVCVNWNINIKAALLLDGNPR